MKSTLKIVLIAMLMVPPILAQKKATAAQKQTKAVPPDKAPAPEADSSTPPNSGETLETPNQRRRRKAAESATVPSPEQYPFTEALGALQGPPAGVPPKQRLKWTPPPQTSVKTMGMAKESIPQGGVSATAADAVEMSGRWQNAHDMPAEGKDGRVVFSDGAGLPTVVCAPLKLCTIELQTGEKLTGEPQIGDSVRWNIDPASYGAGELTTTMIVIKPKAVGLDTNLVITTDRRSYYLRLISSARDYVAKVSFDIPDDRRARWSNVLDNQPDHSCQGRSGEGAKTPADFIEALYSDYRIKGDEAIRPVRVLDDGVHTYIQMNPAVLHREAPVLAILGPDGKAEMVNYRVQGSVYVVDRLFDNARLILGSGRKARKADIIRTSVKGHRLFGRNGSGDLSSDDRKVEEKSR